MGGGVGKVMCNAQMGTIESGLEIQENGAGKEEIIRGSETGYFVLCIHMNPGGQGLPCAK